MIRLMVGLGNPGAEYDGTRHNAGFWFIDEVARQLKAPLAPDRAYFGMAARASRPNGPLWLLEPMTFMNLSGKSVSALARFFKIAPDEILVAAKVAIDHDDTGAEIAAGIDAAERAIREAVLRDRPDWQHDLSALRREGLRRALLAAGDEEFAGCLHA